MILISKPEEILPAYEKWLQISSQPFWAMASQDKAFVEKHMTSTNGIRHYVKKDMDCYEVPLSSTYPASKIGAGVVLTKNTFEVLVRNIDPKLQEFIIEYLKLRFQNPNISKGLKHNSNDIYINGKKVFGELCFSRAGNTYYACMINTYFTEEDKIDMMRGLENDKNFSIDKLHHISGIKNEIPGVNLPELLEAIEEHLFKLAKVPEYIKY